MRRLVAVFALLMFAGPVVAEDAATATWERRRTDVRIPMRDGQALAADVHLPPKPGRYPTILVQTPYDRRRMRVFMERTKNGANDVAPREHYVWVIVDWRGFYGSKAARKARADRGLDGFDCVEWIAKQEFSDGKIGTWGGSALGMQQFATAQKKPPHLVCAAPSIAALGQNYARYYEGGVLLDAHVKTLDRLGFGVGKMVRSRPDPSAPIWKIAASRSFHPEQIEVPLLLVTGWYDNYPGAIIETFDALNAKGGAATRTHSKLVIGPWTHTGVGAAKQGGLSFPGAVGFDDVVSRAFFDRWLRGVENGYDDAPRVRYWRVGETGWTGVPRWPGVPTRDQVLYLHANGEIGATSPGKATADARLTRAYVSDPKNAVPTLGGRHLPPLPLGPTDHARLTKRDDVLTYRTAPLEAPLRVAGAARVRFFVSVDARDVDLAVRLVQIDDAKGTAILAVDSIRRASLRDGRRAWLESGEIVEVVVELPPIALTLPKGARLGLIVSSSNAPRHERNTQAGDATWSEAKATKANVTIYHDAARPTRLELPVLAR